MARLLRITGLATEPHFVNDHRVLNRAAWSPRAASQVLFRLLVSAFVPRGPVVLGLDDTIERRRINAKGISRDPVRSSHGHFTQGLRPALAQPDAAGSHTLGWAASGPCAS